MSTLNTTPQDTNASSPSLERSDRKKPRSNKRSWVIDFVLFATIGAVMGGAPVAVYLHQRSIDRAEQRERQALDHDIDVVQGTVSNLTRDLAKSSDPAEMEMLRGLLEAESARLKDLQEQRE